MKSESQGTASITGGFGDVTPPAECDIASMDRMIDLNVKALVHLTKR